MTGRLNSGSTPTARHPVSVGMIRPFTATTKKQNEIEGPERDSPVKGNFRRPKRAMYSPVRFYTTKKFGLNTAAAAAQIGSNQINQTGDSSNSTPGSIKLPEDVGAKLFLSFTCK